MQESRWTAIVVEARMDHWVAWFEDTPHESRVGESLWAAASALLQCAGWDKFNLEQAQGGYPQQGSTCTRFTVPSRN